MDREEIKRQVLELARQGFILPICPECAIPMDLEKEALAGLCNTCGAEGLDLELILWIKTDSLPQA